MGQYASDIRHNPLQNFDARIVQFQSSGGGHVWTIGTDSNHPFAGRDFGSAKREDIRGTQVFGSGYPYGAVDNTRISGRPFPFGLWPIYWGNNVLGSDEYGDSLDVVRPGGQLVTIPLRTRMQNYTIIDGETYHLIGDRDSVLFMMIALVTSCSVIPAWPSKFIPTSPNSTVKIENVFQYYRASSFALASPGYNNTLVLRNFTTDSADAESTPFPEWIVDSNFMQCIHAILVDALPIMNEEPDRLAADRIVGIVIGTCFIPAALVLWFCVKCGIVWIRGVDRRIEVRLARKRAALRARRAEIDAHKVAFAYENYP